MWKRCEKPTASHDSVALRTTFNSSKLKRLFYLSHFVAEVFWSTFLYSVTSVYWYLFAFIYAKLHKVAMPTFQSGWGLDFDWTTARFRLFFPPSHSVVDVLLCFESLSLAVSPELSAVRQTATRVTLGCVDIQRSSWLTTNFAKLRPATVFLANRTIINFSI